MSPITLAHLGQFVAESKLVGMLKLSFTVNDTFFPELTPERRASRQSLSTPFIDLDAPGALDANLSTSDAFHKIPGVSCNSRTCATRSGWGTTTEANAKPVTEMTAFIDERCLYGENRCVLTSH